MCKKKSIKRMAVEAKEVSFAMAIASTDQKNNALRGIALGLQRYQTEILKANQLDLSNAKQAGLSESMLDRLSLQGRLGGIRADIEAVIKLSDPVGEVFEEKHLLNGLHVAKRRTPIGVLGVIYESRPNVTLDVAALAIKSGNCVILRGGSEALETNQVLIKLLQKELREAGLPENAVQLVVEPDRTQIKKLLKLHDYIDLIIPRGGASLHHFCRTHSQIPVITGGIGVCHMFVDASADLEKSLNVIVNAKTQRPTVCNALDSVLIHEKIVPKFLPMLIVELRRKKVELRLDQHCWELTENANNNGVRLANEEDWDTEWMGLTIGIKAVNGVDDAIKHIRRHSTGHSEGILTEDAQNADRFLREVDSAAVYVNASTRFTDGGQLGLGSEVAISTQKLHARGPMGLKELTTYKWIIRGNYAKRPD